MSITTSGGVCLFGWFSDLILTKRPGKNKIFFCFVFRIGCGLDRLQWENVSAIIEEVFEVTDIKITVYTL